MDRDVATWLRDLSRTLPDHARVLTELVRRAEVDARIRTLLVGCSVGRGAADRLSDLDLNMTVVDGAWPGIVDDVAAAVRDTVDPIELLVHSLPGVTRRHRRVLAHGRSGLQIDLVVQPVSTQTRTGHTPDCVVLHDPDGRLAGVIAPAAAAATSDDAREWCVLGWTALANTVKYLRRESLWEAVEQLHEARTHIWRLWGAARSVECPGYGVTAVLDDPDAGVPVAIEATMPRFDEVGCIWAARSCAGLLESLWPLAWRSVAGAHAPPVPLGPWVLAQLDELSRERAKEPPVTVEPYDPTWPERFETQRSILVRLLDPWLSAGVHHVGSTAVPGLAAKPTVDVMAGVRSLDEARAAIPVLVGDGWLYAPYRTDQMHWFCRPSVRRREFHLHLVPGTSPVFRHRLAFRDALRADADLRSRYAALKHDLARRFAADREAYTRAKAAFIEDAVRDVAG